MGRNVYSVPFGYEPPAEKRKGTLIYYDTFEDTTEEELNMAANHSQTLSFSKLVLYPLHEETVNRLSKEKVSAFYKREKRLYEWKNEQNHSRVVIEDFDGKRKKYTPMDSALRHMTEKYAAPHFLYITPEMANLFASFSSFEEWIVKIRLLLTSEPPILHPRLEKYRHRWSVASRDHNQKS